MILKIAKLELGNQESEFIIKPRKTKYRSKKLKGGVTEMERGRIRRLKELICNKFECASKVSIHLKLNWTLNYMIINLKLMKKQGSLSGKSLNREVTFENGTGDKFL